MPLKGTAMKLIVCAAFALMTLGCAAQPSAAFQEYQAYIERTRPLAQSGKIEWSSYYQGLYTAAVAANAPGHVLAGYNNAIRISFALEAGTLSKQEFESQIRSLQSDSLSRQQADQAASAAEQGRQNQASMATLAIAAQLLNPQPNQYQPVNQSRDYQWHWDQYYNPSYQLVWSCRGAQTGEFADTFRCNGQPQVDWKWPQK